MALDYPLLVAKTKEENTPPGGKKTIELYLKYGDFSKSNRNIILDLACSTGYSSRNIFPHISKQSLIYGIDTSSDAIATAQEKIGKNKNFDYQVMNAADMVFEDEMFSHALVGCNFAFIGELRQKALQELNRVLAKGAIVCAANFFYTSRCPDVLLDELHKILGFRPQHDWDETYWSKFFGKYFDVSFEQVFSLPYLSKLEISSAIRNRLEALDLDIKEKEMYINRSIHNRIIFNEQRKYQNYIVQIWKKR